MAYYQTPQMRIESPDYYLPGEIVNVSGDAIAIKKPNGNYLTVLYDGTDAENHEILDQEQFIAVDNESVVIADRMRYDPPKCYAVALLS